MTDCPETMLRYTYSNPPHDLEAQNDTMSYETTRRRHSKVTWKERLTRLFRRPKSSSIALIALVIITLSIWSTTQATFSRRRLPNGIQPAKNEEKQDEHSLSSWLAAQVAHTTNDTITSSCIPDDEKGIALATFRYEEVTTDEHTSYPEMEAVIKWQDENGENKLTLTDEDKFDPVLFKDEIVLKEVYSLPVTEEKMHSLIQLWERLDHRNIVKILAYAEKETYSDSTKSYLVIMVNAGTCLQDVGRVTVKKANKIDAEAAAAAQQLDKLFNEASNKRAIMRNILSAVCDMHGKDLVHRDLSTDNIALQIEGGNLTGQIVDLDTVWPAGLWTAAEILRHHGMKVPQTPGFDSPDKLRFIDADEDGDTYDRKKADIWAVGAIAYYVCVGKEYPFGLNEKWCKRAVLQYEESNCFNWKVPVTDSVVAKDFIKRFFREKPEDRPTAKEALQHPWISETGYILYFDICHISRTSQDIFWKLVDHKNEEVDFATIRDAEDHAMLKTITLTVPHNTWVFNETDSCGGRANNLWYQVDKPVENMNLLDAQKMGSVVTLRMGAEKNETIIIHIHFQ